MHPDDIAIIILAAGRGTRMKSARAKVLHEVGGLSLIGHALTSAVALNAKNIAIVVGEQSDEIVEEARSHAPEAKFFIQSPPQGTGHAVQCAAPILSENHSAALVLFADTPLIPPQTLASMLEAVKSVNAVCVLGFEPANPGNYGRLICDKSGALTKIVEAKDATAEEKSIGLCNGGAMAFQASFLANNINTLSNNNAQREYYLTDLVGIAVEAGKRCTVVNAAADDVVGVNSRGDLAHAEVILQRRKRSAAMADGVTLRDPETVYFSYDTKLGRDVVIGPNVVLAPGVQIHDNAEIKAFCHLEHAIVERGAEVGPFARIRPGTRIGERARVGNFVEIKKSVLGVGAKVGHLTYIGDAEIGDAANIGAGTITCNYDGVEKHRTQIGAGAFVGSNTSLVAPVTIGDGAYIGSGSVITKNVDPGDLAVARGRQTAVKGWARRFTQSRRKKPGHE